MKLKDFELLETDVPKGVQAVLQFDNYELSIINNEASYGNKQGLFEIAVFKDGDMTELEVDAIIYKMISLTGKQPRQV